ncbi:F-box family protein [Rhynchospora pubera]|uniref:F-box family protein n=1 Tax=Rhynchospora pubera TaxID=906938 RepID=A0AAV8H4B0_9POAL|nr:F-box family protein [Rhynchospora pubera]
MDHCLRNRDWSNMPDDVIRLLVKKLRFYPYHRKAAGACRDWYRITKEVHGSFKQNSIFLLLPYNNMTKTCAFYEIDGSKTYEFNLPKFHDKLVHGSSNGWVCVDDGNLNLSIINPLTGKEIELPYPSYAATEIEVLIRNQPADFFRDPYIRLSILTKFAVLGNPFSTTGFGFAAIMSSFNELFVCRLGDKDWTPIKVRDPDPSYYGTCRFLQDLLYFKGKLFAINSGQEVVIVDFDGSNCMARYVRGPNYQLGDRDGSPSRILSSTGLDDLRYYLVESSGKLLAIRRLGEHISDLEGAKTLCFELFEFDECNETWNMIHGLGEQCVFLGQNASVSVSAVDIPGCRPNCIYFTEDFNNGYCECESQFQNDNGVFCLEDGTVEMFNISHSLSHWLSPSLWCQVNV